MKKQRRRYGADFKAKVALEAIREEVTSAQLCSKYGIDVTQITRWKKELLKGAKDIFTTKKDTKVKELENEVSILYRQVGKLTVQNEFLQEKLTP